MEKLGASVKRSSPAKSSSNNSNNKLKKPVKVVYISNPMKIKASPSEFRAVVQQHTGRYASSSPPPPPPPYAAAGIILNKDNNNKEAAAAAGGGGYGSDLIIPDANYEYWREDDLIMSIYPTDAALNYP